MPTPQRLPVVNGDDGQWGDIINQFLKLQHYDDGTDNPGVNGGHQKVTIRAGTATAGTAPLKFTSGTLLSTPEAGAVEFLTDRLYFTQTTSTTRKVIAAFDDSSGATGDVYYRDSSGNFVRLGIGSNNQVLSVASGVPSWRQAIFAVSTQTGTSYTITSSDTVVIADASSNNVTITLPAASGVTGYRYYVKRKDGSANTVTIARTGSDTIDGATSQTLNQQYTSATVVSDGSNWYII